MSKKYGLPDAEVLRYQRMDRGLSIDQVADWLGLEPHVYEGLENGTRTMTSRQYKVVADRIFERDRQEKNAAQTSAEQKIPGASRPPMPEAASGS